MPFGSTTTIPYVNARPHIGFALELVQAERWGLHPAAAVSGGDGDGDGDGGQAPGR